MIPTKYPERTDNTGADWTDTFREGELFQVGSAKAHADYLIEMKAKHPIMYFLWFRWWIPSLLHDDERKQLDHYIKICRKHRHRSYWAEFAMYHPVQYLLYVLTVLFFQGFIKYLPTPVKVISRLFQSKVIGTRTREIDVNS